MPARPPLPPHTPTPGRTPTPGGAPDPLVRHAPTLAAAAFVLIWSTGFIVARGIAPLADPNLFLAVRFALCGAIFACLGAVRGAAWPARGIVLRLAGTGALLQGLYLGAGFWAVGQGLQPGLMALIGALQPPLTALIAGRLHGEGLGRSARFGLALGVAGVALAVAPGLLGGPSVPADGAGAMAASLPPLAVLAAVVSVLAITAGTLLQKGAAARVDIATSSAVQNGGAFATVALLAVLLGETRFEVSAEMFGLLAYAVIVLSLGGTTLLIWLVRSGSVTRATSLFFLAPPLAMLLAWWLFDEGLGPFQVAGFAVALVGVWLARRS